MNNCEEDTNFYFIFRKISQKLEQICLLIPNKKLKLLSIKLSKKIEDGQENKVKTVKKKVK